MSGESYPSRHFSIANAKDGEHETDLAHLLRRVADEIEHRAIRPMEILDVTVHREITANGPWWDATVHWSPDAD